MTNQDFDRFQTHQMWCEWWINDEYEICDCGFREDLYIPEDFEIAALKRDDNKGETL